MSTELSVKSPVFSLEELKGVAKSIAESKMFGVATEAQAFSLMLLCQAENLHPILALRRYHIIEGKPAMRADALQGDFERHGEILWHERSDKECSATFFRNKKDATAAGIKRAKDRYKLMIEDKPTGHLSEPGELTIIRTLEDAIEKKVACTWKTDKYVMKHNWKQSPRQMLHARCLTEGVRAVMPGLVAGVYSEDEIYDMPAVEATVLNSPEELVRAAGANARSADEAEPTVQEAVIVSETPDEITAGNYGDVVCHIGKAEGPILGKKVSEMPTKVLNYIKDHLEVKTDADKRLSAAVEFALKAKEQAEFKGPFHKQLYEKFEDGWALDHFVEAMKWAKSFESGAEGFYDISEAFAQKCFENFDAVTAIITRFDEEKPKKENGDGKGTKRRS